MTASSSCMAPTASPCPASAAWSSSASLGCRWFTGAMRPYELRTTDALQNLTEALLAVQICAPGVYVAMHNVVLRFPGVVKDPARGTFVRAG